MVSPSSSGYSFERYTRDEAQMVYWVIGQLLGVPFAQDVKGTLLYDVRDTGQDPTKGARFSVSNVESSFHMDHCFGDPIPDILGCSACRERSPAAGASS